MMKIFSIMRGRRMIIRIMLFGLAALSAVASAGDLYRWVDENGRTHVSDVVPAPYRDIAKRVDTRASEISDSQRQEALARATREKQLADERDRAAQSEQPPPPAPATGRAADLTPPDNSAAECEQLIREYRESQECFAPFMFSRRDGRHRRSGVREEAYLYCKRVQSPYAKCGLPSRSPSDEYSSP
jgi:hypothetical protein